MKNLILVRHAKSSWDFPELSDFERPLNSRGKVNAPEMGARLKKQMIIPDLILASPAERALKTAEFIAAEIGYPPARIQKDRSLYHADYRTFLHVLHGIKDEFNIVMLVGHNPGLTDLACDIGDQFIDNIPTSGIVGIGLPIGSWHYADHGTTLFFDYPRNTSQVSYRLH